MTSITTDDTVEVNPLYWRRLLRLESIIRVARHNGLFCQEQYDQNRINDWFEENYRAG